MLNLRDNRGFTLIELVLTMTIIGIFSSVATVRFADFSETAKATACMQNQIAIETGAAIYYSSTAISSQAHAATSLEDLLPFFRVDNVPTCPGEGEYSFDGFFASCSETTHDRYAVSTGSDGSGGGGDSGSGDTGDGDTGGDNGGGNGNGNNGNGNGNGGGNGSNGSGNGNGNNGNGNGNGGSNK
ncbi:type II secretion system protein [candidate division KSB1 bacterium]|nr:type II secretion system protein [candidate division KSB1 bacterium]